MTAMKDAMKAKDQTALAALRAVKSEILLAKTSGGDEGLSEDDEIKIVQKLVKQRKDSARIFSEQNREDLSEPELAQAAVLEKFLPEQMSEEEITKVVSGIITKTGASGMKDMGKVMGMANKELAGKADGRTISTIVKSQLT
ncbi:YqeY family protein [Nonlabens dokdonensis DSW-6]|uniref:YqeY family protein n=2 Tax=Nonlabens dokdonensis TaxID=328515 RepID=L7W344_NONDD|nr:YqeY family protein [Nonlabens dokdonensis DSW-6]